MKKKFIAAIFAFLSLSFNLSFAQEKPVESKETPLSILFIGNSYTHMHDMPSIFRKIAESRGKNVIVDKNTQAGGSFRIHSARPDMYEKIKSRKWDIVVLQGYSRELSHSPSVIDTATIPYINQIMDSVKLNNPCVRFLFYNTWGYKNGFLEREEVNTYKKMQDSINAGYRYIANHYKVPIVPVGYVWNQLMDTTNGINLYAPDLAHPSIVGSYMIACTFYASIFHEPTFGVATATISSESAKLIQKTADELVLSRYNDFNLNQNSFYVNYKVDGNINKIKIVSSYQKAKKITWYFGDGKKSNDASPSHMYKHGGEYVVKCIIEDECGVRVYKKLVKIEKVLKPKKSKSKKTTTDNVNKKI